MKAGLHAHDNSVTHDVLDDGTPEVALWVDLYSIDPSEGSSSLLPVSEFDAQHAHANFLAVPLPGTAEDSNYFSLDVVATTVAQLQASQACVGAAHRVCAFTTLASGQGLEEPLSTVAPSCLDCGTILNLDNTLADDFPDPGGVGDPLCNTCYYQFVCERTWCMHESIEIDHIERGRVPAWSRPFRLPPLSAG